MNANEECPRGREPDKQVLRFMLRVTNFSQIYPTYLPPGGVVHEGIQTLVLSDTMAGTLYQLLYRGQLKSWLSHTKGGKNIHKKDKGTGTFETA